MPCGCCLHAVPANLVATIPHPHPELLFKPEGVRGSQLEAALSLIACLEGSGQA